MLSWVSLAIIAKMCTTFIISLLEKRDQSRVPPAPVGRPLLIPVQTESGRVLAGQFTVDLSGAVPQLQSCESANVKDSSVAFLFKFEDTHSMINNAAFNWTVSATY